MEYVYIFYVFNLFFAIITIKIAKKKYLTLWNHYFVYNFLWLLLIFLSIFFNDYLRPVSVEVYFIFLVSLFFFNITIVFVKKTHHRLIKPVKLNLKKRRFLELFVIAFLLPGAIVNLMLIRTGIPLYELNYEYWTVERSSGAYLYLQFQELFLFPVALLLISSIFYSNYDSYSKFSYTVTAILGMILTGCYFLISGGGRAEVMIFFFVIILSYFAYSNNNLHRYVKIPPKRMVLPWLVGLAFIIQFANEGRGKEEGLLKNAINGYIIYAPLFEHYLNSSFFISNNTFGASLFEPFVLISQLPLKLFGITIYDTTINDISQQFVYLPSFGKEYNNQVTSCFVYMRDFSWFGIFIGPMIAAWIFDKIFHICRYNTFLFLLYFTYVLRLCGTNINFQINKVFIFAIIYAFLFCKYCKVQ